MNWRHGSWKVACTRTPIVAMGLVKSGTVVITMHCVAVVSIKSSGVAPLSVSHSLQPDLVVWRVTPVVQVDDFGHALVVILCRFINLIKVVFRRLEFLLTSMIFTILFKQREDSIVDSDRWCSARRPRAVWALRT